MKVERIDIAKVLDKDFIDSLSLEYTLEYFYDKVVAKKSFEKISIVNLIEGRYFNEKHELKIYKFNGEYRATLISDETNDEVLKVEHLVIDNKFEDISKIAIKKYIDYDDEGQAFIKCLRPFKFI